MDDKDKTRRQLLTELQILRKKVAESDNIHAEFQKNNENLQLYQAHLEEITKLRTSELLEALKKAERANDIKDSFLANMSHEFHTPIHQINNFSQLGVQKLRKTIETGVTVPENKLLKYFENIYFASENLFTFINSLFDLGRLETGEVQYDFMTGSTVKAARTAQYGISDSIREKEIVFEILESEADSEVEFDQHWFGEILKHLFSNAVKFSPKGGSITVSFKKQQIGQFEQNLDGLQIDISDQGIGIPVDELDFIFEKFTQSSRTEDGSGGKGIGLAICRKIVADHNGDIYAANNPDGGATISLTLPYQQPIVDSGVKVYSGFDNI